MISVDKQLDEVLLFHVFRVSCEEKSWCKMVVCVLKIRLVSTYDLDIIPGTSHCSDCLGLASCARPPSSAHGHVWVKDSTFRIHFLGNDTDRAPG